MARNPLALILAAVLAALLFTDAGFAQCRLGTNTCGNEDCDKIPTSFQVANGHLRDTGWWPNGGKCGTEPCFIIFRCECGEQLGTTICEGGNSCDCGPGTGQVCEKSTLDDDLAQTVDLAQETFEQSYSEAPQVASISPEEAIADLNVAVLSDWSRNALDKAIGIFVAHNLTVDMVVARVPTELSHIHPSLWFVRFLDKLTRLHRETVYYWDMLDAATDRDFILPRRQRHIEGLCNAPKPLAKGPWKIGPTPTLRTSCHTSSTR